MKELKHLMIWESFISESKKESLLDFCNSSYNMTRCLGKYWDGDEDNVDEETGKPYPEHNFTSISDLATEIGQNEVDDLINEYDKIK